MEEEQIQAVPEVETAMEPVAEPAVESAEPATEVPAAPAEGEAQA